MTFPPDNIVRRGSKEEEQHALPKHGFLQLFEFGPEQLRAMACLVFGPQLQWNQGESPG